LRRTGTQRRANANPWCTYCMYCGWRKGTSQDRLTLNSQACSLIHCKLCLAGGINKLVSQPGKICGVHNQCRQAGNWGYFYSDIFSLKKHIPQFTVPSYCMVYFHWSHTPKIRKLGVNPSKYIEVTHSVGKKCKLKPYTSVH